MEYAQHRVETLLVNGHDDGNVRQVGVNLLVRAGLDGRVVLRVLVVMSDGTDGHGDVLHDLQVEELKDG